MSADKCAAALTGLVFLLALLSPINYVNSDPRFTLLVGQAILEHGSVVLDPYQASIAEHGGKAPYQLVRRGEHLLYGYPLGTSLLTLPAVALARALGVDMASEEVEFHLQNLISAIFCALAFVLLYRMGLGFVSSTASLAISAVWVLGSPIMSTMATGLWSMSGATMLAMVSLWLTMRPASYGGAALTGLALGLAFLCRPTAVVFAGGLLALLLFARPASAIVTALTGCATVALFAAAHHRLIGVWLPSYYDYSRTLGIGNLATNLAGVLFSPSRGFFVFCPFAAVTIAGAILYFRHPAVMPWASLAIICTAATVGVVAAWIGWWGGHSFGPRLLTELVPPLAVATFAEWRAETEKRPARAPLTAVLFLALGAAGIFIHSVQGLWNPSAARWNSVPDVDANRSSLWDWRYPQFAMTLSRLRERHLEYALRGLAGGSLALAPYVWGERLDPSNSRYCLFIGWWTAPDGEWWSESNTAYIVFRAPEMPANASLSLKVESRSIGPALVAINLNEHGIGRFRTSGGGVTEATFSVEPGRLIAPGINVLALRIPGAGIPPLAFIAEHGLRYAAFRLALRDTAIAMTPDSAP